MEVINLPYSQKNIPIPSKFTYQKQLVAKTEHFSRRLRWKMFYILNPKENLDQKETLASGVPTTPPPAEGVENL